MLDFRIFNRFPLKSLPFSIQTITNLAFLYRFSYVPNYIDYLCWCYLFWCLLFWSKVDKLLKLVANVVFLPFSSLQVWAGPFSISTAILYCDKLWLQSTFYSLYTLLFSLSEACEAKTYRLAQIWAQKADIDIII